MGKKTVLSLVRVMHAGGGVTLNVSSLLKHIASCTDWRVVLITAPKAGAPPLRLDSTDGLEVRMLETRRPPSFLEGIIDCWPIDFKKTLLDILPGIDIVHHHSLWRYPTRVGCPIMRHINKPYIIAPRGTLNPWALSFRGFRKKFALWMHERKNLSSSVCLHATSEAEAGIFRSIGLKNPIAVIPAGVSCEATSAYYSISHKSIGKYEAHRKRRILCVARIHPIKCIKELVYSWIKLANRFPDWELVLVGSGSTEYESKIRKVLQANSEARKRTIFRGYLAGKELWKAYKEADVFVLPSHSENFGSVVVEAMAAELPIITTKGTPWAQLVTRKCGWWIPVDLNSLTLVLEEAMSLSDDERLEMGRKGRIWTEESFTWPQIAKKTVELYEWIINGCHKSESPDCVL